MTVSGASFSISQMMSAVAGALPCLAVPIVRRTPRQHSGAHVGLMPAWIPQPSDLAHDGRNSFGHALPAGRVCEPSAGPPAVAAGDRGSGGGSSSSVAPIV